MKSLRHVVWETTEKSQETWQILCNFAYPSIDLVAPTFIWEVQTKMEPIGPVLPPFFLHFGQFSLDELQKKENTSLRKPWEPSANLQVPQIHHFLPPNYINPCFLPLFWGGFPMSSLISPPVFVGQSREVCFHKATASYWTCHRPAAPR